MYFKDLTGQKFGRLLVKKHIGSDDNHQALWQCICDCGNEHVATGHNLIRGVCKSCGCLKNELSSARLTKHGESRSRVYDIWVAMIQRCHNEHHNRYKHYGGRGIVVCDEWRNNPDSFIQWAKNNGYSDDLTIDRIDVNGNYEPENCRWISNFEQQQNRTNSHLIEYEGKTFTISQLARAFQIKPNVLERRLKSGWDVDRAIKQPIRHTNRHKDQTCK